MYVIYTIYYNILHITKIYKYLYACRNINYILEFNIFLFIVLYISSLFSSFSSSTFTSTILTNISHCEAYLILNIDFYISCDSVQQKLKLFSEEYFFSYLPLHFIKSCHIICDHKPPYLIIPHHMLWQDLIK